MKRVMFSVFVACSLLFGVAAWSDATEEEIDWTEYNDDDGTPDFEDSFGSGLSLSSSEDSGDYGFGARAVDWGDCEYVDTTLDYIQCDIDNDHLDYIAIGLADYLEGGSKIIIMCYDDGTDVSLVGWAKIQTAHKLYINGSAYSDDFGIIRGATYYTSACDFADFPNTFDEDYYVHGELTMTGNGGVDTVSGSQWQDSSLAAEKVYGKQADDIIVAEGASSAQLYGNYGDDHITGTAGADTIYGGHDFDTIHAGSGDDYIEGGPNGDDIYGQAGNDEIYGEGGQDEIWGGDGQDEIYGGSGQDYIEGGANYDELHGGSAADTIYGNTSTSFSDGYINRLYGDTGDDKLNYNSPNPIYDWCDGVSGYDGCWCGSENNCDWD